MKNKKRTTIPPQTLKGFRDFYASEAKLRQYVIGIFKGIFEKYGYEPLETPALEYAQILTGKGGGEVDKLSYIFKDQGGRLIGLKYDLTVPSCRFVAQNFSNLIFPFKRYMIQPVWRAEKPQKGRFREFVQCDADVWGTTSPLVEAEFIQMGIEAIQKLGFKDFVTRINNRKIINAIFAYAQAKEKDYYPLAISIDKLEKIGIKGVKKELEKKGIDKSVSQKILGLVSSTKSSKEQLSNLKKILKGIPEAQEGIQELEIIFSYLETLSIDSRFYKYDPSIIRGMSYYTGPVWEFTVKEGNVGSIGGCGRYDKLTGTYIGRNIPAAGGSFGIERIIEVIKDRNMIPQPKSISQVLIVIFSKELKDQAFLLAKNLRNANIITELYPDPEAKLQKQLKYANQKEIPFVLIIGPDEAKNKTITLKDMINQKQETLTQKNLLKRLSG